MLSPQASVLNWREVTAFWKSGLKFSYGLNDIGHFGGAPSKAIIKEGFLTLNISPQCMSFMLTGTRTKLRKSGWTLSNLSRKHLRTKSPSPVLSHVVKWTGRPSTDSLKFALTMHPSKSWIDNRVVDIPLQSQVSESMNVDRKPALCGNLMV